MARVGLVAASRHPGGPAHPRDSAVVRAGPVAASRRPGGASLLRRPIAVPRRRTRATTPEAPKHGDATVWADPPIGRGLLRADPNPCGARSWGVEDSRLKMTRGRPGRLYGPSAAPAVWPPVPRSRCFSLLHLLRLDLLPVRRCMWQIFRMMEPDSQPLRFANFHVP